MPGRAPHQLLVDGPEVPDAGVPQGEGPAAEGALEGLVAGVGLPVALGRKIIEKTVVTVLHYIKC